MDVTEEEYNGIKKLMAELHDENDRCFYDIDLRECIDKKEKKKWFLVYYGFYIEFLTLIFQGLFLLMNSKFHLETIDFSKNMWYNKYTKNMEVIFIMSKVVETIIAIGLVLAVCMLIIEGVVICSNPYLTYNTLFEEEINKLRASE